MGRIWLAVLVLGMSWSACASDGWMSPAGHTDVEDKWKNESRAYDASETSYAEDWSNRSGYGGWLELDLAEPVYTDRVRVSADFGFGIVDKVDLDVKYDGAAEYADAYEGAIQNVDWTTLSFAAGDVTSVRFRFHYTTNGYVFWLFGLQAYALPPAVEDPSVATDPATSVNSASAVLHGRVTDDGGEPCEVRFAYGTDATYGQATPWTAEHLTGEFVDAPVEGLTEETTYHFCIQARRDEAGTVVSGADESFTTAPVPDDGSVVWVTPVGTTDPDDAWEAEARSRDDNPDTAARCYHELSAGYQWSQPLHFGTDLSANGIGINAQRDEFVDQVDVDVLRDGAWVDVYKGRFEDRVRDGFPFDPGTVTEARIRLHVNTDKVGQYWYIHEVDLHHAAETISITTPEASAVSPAWVEGEIWAPGHAIQVTAGGASASAARIGRLGWYADGPAAGPLGIELTAGTATALEVKAVKDGTVAQTCTQSLTWTPTDLTGQDSAADSLTLRAGSRLLLTASGDPGQALAIDADGDGSADYTGAAGDTLAFAYATAGTYVASATLDGAPAGSLTVHAASVAFDTAKCIKNLDNRKTIPVTPVAVADEVRVEAVDPYKVRIDKQTVTDTGVKVFFEPRTTTSSELAARLGGLSGPILALADTEVATLKFRITKAIPIIKRFDNGDDLVAGSMKMTPKLDGLRIRLYIFTGGAVFEDGTTEQWVSSSAFSPEGYRNYYIMDSTRTKIGCHATNVVEDE